jgi:hypothetical protein
LDDVSYGYEGQMTRRPDGEHSTHVRARRGAALIALACAAIVASGTTSAAASSHGTVNCLPPRYPGVGYFTSLMVSGTTCAEGKKVAIAYYYCRTKHGLAGHCEGGVLGFKCTERRESIPTEIDARVTCTKGDEKVVHTYQQDTQT